VSEKWPSMTGSRNLMRVSASAVGYDTCLEQQAVKARPAVWPAQSSRARKPRMNDFPLGLVMDAVDDVEFRGRSHDEALARLGSSGKPVHPGARHWGRQSAAAYLDGMSKMSTDATKAVRHYWVAQQTAGEKIWELYSWGRRYESVNGAYREFRFLSFGTDSDDHDPAKVALAAYTAAHGRPASWPDPWTEPFRLLSTGTASVRHVRVLKVSLLDGTHSVLFEGTPEEASALYAEHARDRVRAVIAGGSARPGYGCADCKLVTACEALLRLPGLLGITDPTAPLRTWSVSNGRYYSVCPARDYLIRLNLPRENEYDQAAVRGQAVHERLAEIHGRSARSACTTEDLTVPPGDWTAGKWHVTGDQALIGARMLARHADVCPFLGAGRITEVRLEPVLAFHDTSANVIVTARPDMLYLEEGAWVWRETKTRSRPLRPGTELLEEFQQLALAVVLIAEGALGGGMSGARIELELLTADSGDVLFVDPNDPVEISNARTVVHGLVEPWHADEAAAARPGTHCAACAVRRWCLDARTPDGETETRA
jgi:hypothetical protein